MAFSYDRVDFLKLLIKIYMYLVSNWPSVKLICHHFDIKMTSLFLFWLQNDDYYK